MLLAPYESSSHVSARRKTEEPPSRPSGGAEGDSPLGWDAEGAAGGPSGPLHGPAPGITTHSCGGGGLYCKHQPNPRPCCGCAGRFLLHRGHSSFQKRGGISLSLSLRVCVWLGSGGGCACMCSAPYGRKKRPRSAGIIFPISKVAQTEPERRESTEGAVDGSRMVSTEIISGSDGQEVRAECSSAPKDRLSFLPDRTDFIMCRCSSGAKGDKRQNR